MFLTAAVVLVVLLAPPVGPTLTAQGIMRELDAAGELRPILPVVSSVASGTVITSSLEADITAQVSHKLWRGTVDVTVTAPAHLHFGVDLHDIQVKNPSLALRNSGYRVILPEPKLITYQLALDQLEEDFRLTGTRLRSRAGEFYRNEAILRLDDNVERYVLDEPTRQRLRDDAEHAIGRAVQAIVGTDTPFHLEFSHE